MQSADDRRTGTQLKELFPETGTYVVPSMKNDPELLASLHEAGPIATVHVRHEGAPVMDPMMMVTGFAHELVSVGFAAVLLLSLGGSLNTYSKRVGFLVCLGAMIAWFSPLSAPIWWMHPWPMHVVDAVYIILAWTITGLVLAAFIGAPVKKAG
ncbi:MAG TPA: hypothetical protein DCY13_02570 [Verrucomicrobiales bacterium]|nr:hypothetical protein [Verrucomicrobiales bacterium]